MRAVDDGNDSVTGSMTFTEFVAGPFQATLRGYSPSVQRSYIDVASQVCSIVGRTRIENVNDETMNKLVRQLIVQGRMSVRSPAVFMRAVMRSAVAHGLATKVPPMPKGASAKNKEKKEPPKEEVIMKMIAKADGWLKTAMWLTCECYFRLGEVRGLRWADVDFKVNKININNTMSDNQLIPARGTSKLRAGRMSPELAAYLFEQCEGGMNEHVVVNKYGNVPTRTNFLSGLKRFCLANDFQPVSFDVLRFSLLKKGVRSSLDLLEERRRSSLQENIDRVAAFLMTKGVLSEDCQEAGEK